MIPADLLVRVGSRNEHVHYLEKGPVGCCAGGRTAIHNEFTLPRYFESGRAAKVRTATAVFLCTCEWHVHRETQQYNLKIQHSSPNLVLSPSSTQQDSESILSSLIPHLSSLLQLSSPAALSPLSSLSSITSVLSPSYSLLCRKWYVQVCLASPSCDPSCVPFSVSPQRTC